METVNETNWKIRLEAKNYDYGVQHFLSRLATRDVRGHN